MVKNAKRRKSPRATPLYLGNNGQKRKEELEDFLANSQRKTNRELFEAEMSANKILLV